MDLATLTFITATVAGTCMAVCQVPQAWKIYKEGKAEGLSIWMQITITTGVFFWFLTGVILAKEDDPSGTPMWISNGVCLIFCIYVLAMIIRTNRNKRSK